MWMTWNDLDRHFAALDLLRREVERNLTGPAPDRSLGRWPEASLVDAGDRYTVTVDVPGLRQEDLTLDVNPTSLTIAAHRTVSVPEGYATHRNERSAFSWKRSLSLPGKVDTEKSTAQLEHGVLVVHLAKLPEAQPRRISIA